MSFFDSAISSLGQGLEATAIQAASNETGVNVGGLIGVLYGGNQKAGGQNLAQVASDIARLLPAGADQTAVLNVLNQQNRTLASMGNQLAAVSQSLQTITSDLRDIEAQLQQIAEKQAYMAWEIVDTSLAECLNTIGTAYATYGSYMADYKKTPPADIQELVTDILSLDPDAPAAGIALINSYILGDGERQGVLQLWSAMVVPAILAGTLDYRDAVQQYESYYQTLTYAQLCATNLLMEGQSFRGGLDQVADAWKSYKQYLVSQEDPFITWLIPLVAAGQGFPYSFTGAHGAIQLNPGVQQLAGGSSYYEPSTVFGRAEELLASLAVTHPAARRVVVHMLYVTEFGIDTMLNGVDLTLSSTPGGATIVAASSGTLGAPFPTVANSGADRNFAHSGAFFVKRFVYGGDASLPDGGYAITDVNGMNGLVPVGTYAGGFGTGAPFLGKGVVAHTLSVNGSRTFDFMNFMAYSAPTLGLDG